MRAEQAAGAAFQSAINPDGTFNPNAALAGIRNNPDAAFAAPGAISTGLAQQGNILDNRNREISIATNKLNLGVANNDAFAKIAAPYALQPKMSDEDVLNLKVKAAAAGVNPTTIAAADVRTPVKAMRAANLAAKQTMGPATAAQPTRGAPSATGAPTDVPLASTLGGSPRPVGLSPEQSADYTQYTEDTAKSSQIMASLRPLQTALPLIEKLNDVTNFGPGSKQFTKLKAALVNTGVIAPGTTDAAVRQEAGKYLLQNVVQAPGAGRSDEGLNSIKGSNPDADTMLKPAVLDTIKNKIAMDRQDAALPLAGGSAAGYSQNFKPKYYPNTDVRAFKFDLMSPQERRDTINSLGPKDSPAYQRFMKGLEIAQKTNMLHSQADLNNMIYGPDTQAPTPQPTPGHN